MINSTVSPFITFTEPAQKKYNILLVDDIPSNLNYLSDVLHKEGFGIMLATTGKEALLAARRELPDLILLEIALPEMDGYEVSCELKKDPFTQDIPVIFITARTEHEDIIKGFEVGAVDYIIKPFTYSELVARIKTQLELRKKTKELRYINMRLEELVRQRTNELQESNKNLTELNSKLKRAYEELSKLHKVKNEFVRHINHELRTPLQGIRGFTMILEELVETPEQKEYINSINQLVNRLVHLSEMSLLFTEMRLDNYKLQLEEVDLNEFVNQHIHISEYQSRNIVFYPSENDIFIKADPELLSACLKLIVDNAIKYSPLGSEIKIESLQSENKAMLKISDQGPGFSKKALKNLYELFSADNQKYNKEGFGIGLATAKLIIDTLSSDIKIYNMPEKGACVQLIFPCIIR
jgi:two-component system sensor histidine kinase/response regulator